MDELLEVYQRKMAIFSEGDIVRGKVLKNHPSEVMVDIGYESEGLLPANEVTDYNGNVSRSRTSTRCAATSTASRSSLSTRSGTTWLVARALNLPHIDTGAVAFAAKRAGVGTRDAAALERLASNVRIELIPGDPPRVLLDGEDVTALLRTPDMSMAASDVSAVAGVRRVLVRLQLEMGHRHGGVLEGRDIGTKVFSGTPHKFFLTARPEIRARRRTNEMLAKGQPADYETVLAHSQDATRQDSPLIYDKSYTVIDTIDPSIEDVVKRVVAAVGS